jgi:threonyl-tRNA synthetase
MIHRALYGSLERFLGIILEHFGGFFPLWLAPLQISIMPVSDRFNDFAKEIRDKLAAAGFRVDFDERSEKIGYKIREAEAEKRVPYMLVIGEKEKDTGIFTVRQHKKGNIGEFDLDTFIERVKEERDKRVLPEGYKLEL